MIIYTTTFLNNAKLYKFVVVIDSMVYLVKKVIGVQEHYYLEHTFREKDTFKKKTKYLGKTVPKDVEKLKKEFLMEIYKEKWHVSIEKIKENHAKELKSMPESLKDKNMETFAIKFTYDTQRIEGSKLTLKETADLLERGITPRAKPLSDAKEAEAHKMVFCEMLEHKKDLSLQVVLYWHKKFFDGTKPDIAGKIREHQVAISGSRFMPPFPAEIYPRINEFFRWYSNSKGKMHPVDLAALVHLKFVTIHPFADGNGRISRLMMNFVLNNYGYPLLNIPYNNRASYYNALERAQTRNEEHIFIQWFFRRYIKEHKRFLKD